MPSQLTDDAAAARDAPPISFKEMAAKQNQCTETQRLLGRTSLTIVPTSWQTPHSQQCLNRGFRLVVRKKFQQEIFSHLHKILRPGRLASCRLVLSRYFWSGLAWDMTAWTKTCLHCQQSKIQHHIPVSQHHFSHIYNDLLGPLQLSNNCNYIFTIIDCTSKWMEAIPLAALPQLTVHEPLSFIGLPALEYLPRSLLIMACNLHISCL